MEKVSIVRNRRYEISYLIVAIGIALFGYTGLKWYQQPTPEIPQTRSRQIEQAHNLYQQGNELYKKGNLQTALEKLHQAIAIYPEHAAAHTLMSIILMRSGNNEHAIEHAQKATTSNNNYIPGHVALGQAYEKVGNITDAKNSYHNALKIDNRNIEPHILLTKLLAREMTPESCNHAIEHAQSALKIDSQNSEALFALGDAYLSAGKPKIARESYQKVSDKGSQYRTLLSIGQSFERERNFHEAQNYYKQAIRTNENQPQGHVLLAGTHFALGNLYDGFKEYEWRWKLSNMANLTNKWDGSPLNGKRILILAENGLGDIIQYVRFAQIAKEQGTYVIVNAPKPLVPLLKLVDYIDEVIEIGQPITLYDEITSMQSIPAVANISKGNFLNKPYLVSDSNRLQQWKTKLADDKKFKIGLCWQPGDDSYMGIDQKRLLELHLLKPLAHEGVSFYCLQKNADKTKIKESTLTINTFDDNFDEVPFLDTAAIMQQMDLVISIDTSVAHLAGALGVKTWLLLPYASDVRWMVDSSDSIWYPSFTLFRQPTPGDWQTVIKKVSNSLHKELKRNDTTPANPS